MRLARESGFASLWFPDHYIIGPVLMPQPMPLMAWLLREAEGMTVGPNIRILPLLNPVQVAEEAATLDLLSGGNTCWGWGWAIGRRSLPPSTYRSPSAPAASARASG